MNIPDHSNTIREFREGYCDFSNDGVHVYYNGMTKPTIDIEQFILKALEQERQDVLEARNREIGNGLRRIVEAHPENELIIVNDVLNFADHLSPQPLQIEKPCCEKCEDGMNGRGSPCLFICPCHQKIENKNTTN